MVYAVLDSFLETQLLQTQIKSKSKLIITLELTIRTISEENGNKLGRTLLLEIYKILIKERKHSRPAFRPISSQSSGL